MEALERSLLHVDSFYGFFLDISSSLTTFCQQLNSETTAFQRTFTQEIRRLDNVERQLRYFQSQIKKESIPIRPQHEFSNVLAAPSASEIDELSDKSESLEQRVASLNDSYETLKKREVELTEWRWVLTEAGGFFDRVGSLDCISSRLSLKLIGFQGPWECRRDPSVY